VALSIEAGICNLALLRAQQLQRITSLSDRTPAGEACNTIWEYARDATLEAAAWPFAMKREAVTPITDGERGAWAYAYLCPNDCIAPRSLDVADADHPLGTYNTNPGEREQLVFTTESDEATGRRVVLTNVENAVIVYTARIKEPARWTAMFRNALAFQLASDLAFGLAKNQRLGFSMLQAFERYIRLAAASSFNQEKAEVPPESDLINSRGG
jgi:hypothetical protein